MPTLKLPTIFLFFHFGPLSFNLAFSLKKKKTKSILLPIWPQKDQFQKNKKRSEYQKFFKKRKENTLDSCRKYM
jgi:hypothetical protein